MDPPVEEEAAAAAPPQRMQRRRRRIGSRRLVELTLNFTISFAILSLLKLEPIARNSVRDHNSIIDLPHQEEKLLKSTDDDANNNNTIQESETSSSSSSSSVISAAAGNNISVQHYDDENENRRKVGALVDNAKLLFCGNNQWKDTKSDCNERVSYLIHRYGATLSEAKESLLLREGCACSISASANQIMNHVHMTNNMTIPESSLLLAPWDASEAVGGSERIKNACQKEIEESECHGKLPLYNCLMGYFLSVKWLLFSECKRVVDPCTDEGRNYTISGIRRGCSAIAKAFQQSALNGIETRRLESLLQRMDVSFATKTIRYWMAAGGTIGSLYHHGRVPWDDDVDINVLDQDVESALEVLKRNGLAVSSDKGGGLFKIYDPSMPAISTKYNHSYPFVDIFPVQCNKTSCAEKTETENWGGTSVKMKRKIAYPIDWIFPLKWRPFGRNSLPFPNKLTYVVEIRYVLLTTTKRKGFRVLGILLT